MNYFMLCALGVFIAPYFALIRPTTPQPTPDRPLITNFDARR
jgi:hypothetical protein